MFYLKNRKIRKQIHIKVNDEPVNIRMEIGANGMSSEQIVRTSIYLN